MKIVTLTVNPAIDVHLYTEKLTVGEDNPARLLRRDSGGKGVNISRALTANGVDNYCYMILGECGHEDFVRPLEEYGMRIGYLTVDGFTRENINIHTDNGETVIASEGAFVSAEAFGRMREDILGELDTDSILCFAGRLAKGMDKKQIVALLSEAKERGVRLVLDSKSLGIEDYKVLRPYLIKPNKSEAGALLGTELKEIADALCAARRLHSSGIDNVLITLGKEGAVYVGTYGEYTAEVPFVNAVSSVGAGDSTIAGFLSAVMSGCDGISVIREALAFGTAACMEEGTLPPTPCRINELKEKVTVYKM